MECGVSQFFRLSTNSHTPIHTFIYRVQETSERFGAHKPCMRFFQQGSLGTRNFWIVRIQKCGHNHSFAREYLQENFIFQMIFDIGIFGGGEESSSFTQERFTDHEGGRSLSLVFQFTSHLLTFSKYVFFHTPTPFCPAGFAWLFHILFFLRQNKANSWKENLTGKQFQTIKEIIWYC